MSERTENLRVAYVLGQFPSLTETFILEEMAQLDARGIHIIPCALNRPTQGQPVHDKAERFLDRTVYRPPASSAEAAWDWLAACLRWPKGASSASLLTAMHSVRTPSAARELFTGLAAACHYAPAVRRERVQHIHAQFGSKPATVGLLLAEITALPFSLSLHARDVFTDESIILPTKLHEAEFATVCTQHGLERLRATQPAGVHGRLHLVRHGIDITRFAADRHQPAREPIIAMVGRLIEKKGHQVLLRAAEMLRRSRGRFRIAVAGDGPLLAQLEGLATSLGIGHLVTFCGPLSQEEVRQLLIASRMLVVPSVVAPDGDRDGLPNVILEAAAVGTPIVATHVSAIPEFVEHRSTGLVVEPDNPKALAEAMKTVLDDPVGAQTMGDRARVKVIREYDVSRNAMALEALFREALGRGLREEEAKRAQRPGQRRPRRETDAEE